ILLGPRVCATVAFGTAIQVNPRAALRISRRLISATSSERANNMATSILFDHLVAASQQCRWQNDPKRLCGFQIDDQFELGRLFDWHIGGLRPAKNLVDEIACTPEHIRRAGPVRRQAARLNILSKAVHRRYPLP